MSREAVLNLARELKEKENLKWPQALKKASKSVKTEAISQSGWDQLEVETIPKGTIFYRGVSNAKYLEEKAIDGRVLWITRDPKAAEIYIKEKPKGVVGKFQSIKPMNLIKINVANVKKLYELAKLEFGDTADVHAPWDSTTAEFKLKHALKLVPKNDPDYHRLLAFKNGKTISHKDLLDVLAEITDRYAKQQDFYDLWYKLLHVSKGNYNPEVKSTIPYELERAFGIGWDKKSVKRSSVVHVDDHIVRWICSHTGLHGYTSPEMHDHFHEEDVICPIGVHDLKLVQENSNLHIH